VPEFVPLQPAQHTLCYDADYPWLSQWQWYLIPNDYNPLVRCVLWVSLIECRIETMHRMIMTAYHGPNLRYTGHRDSDTLNNQRSNLYWQKRRTKRRVPGGGYGIARWP
jgi:hypothetical protein